MTKTPEQVKEELYEKLAAIEHERWADWQQYCHKQGWEDDRGNLVLPKECVRRWERQIDTPYSQLTEKEKQSDRDQVDRYWPLIESYADTIREQASKEWEDCIPLETQGKNTEYCEGWNDMVYSIRTNAKEKGLL